MTQRGQLTITPPLIRIARALRRAATPLAVMAVASVLALPLVSGAPSVRADQGTTAKSEAATNPRVQVRSLPLLQPGGLVEAAFPNGEGLENVGKVRRIGDQLGSAAGIANAMADLWRGLDPDMIYNREGLSDGFPYDYPTLDAFAAAMTPPVVDAHADELMELANLLVLAAAQSDPAGPVTGLSRALPGAEVIMRALAAQNHSCDVQLTYAWVVSMGEAPARTTYDRLFGKAVKACPKDPTARWLWGHRMIEDSIAARMHFHGGMTRKQALARPVDFFRRWVAEKPQSVLGQAGLGDALVTEAEDLHSKRVMPFTARADAEKARSAFQRALHAHPEPEFVLGLARTAAVLGKGDAVALVNKAVALKPRSLAFQEAASTIREAAHDFTGAAESAAAPVDPVDALHLVPTNRDEGRPAWLGGANAAARTMWDATGGEYGAGVVDWLGFIPDYRADFVVGAHALDPSCRRLARLRNLVLAGNDAAAEGLATSPDQFTCASTSVLGVEQRWEFGYSESASADTAQNFWRYGGNLDRARGTVETWVRNYPDPRGYQRLGEIDYLQQDWKGAIRAFTAASQGYEGEQLEDGSTWSWVDTLESYLMLGLAYEKAGNTTQALNSYARVTGVGVNDTGDVPVSTVRANYTAAEERTATILAQQGEPDQALPHYRAAAQSALKHDRTTNHDVLDTSDPMSSGAEYNNYAAALVDRGKDLGTAVRFAKMAIALDPQSPVFQDTLAQAQEAAGMTHQAASAYDRAVKSDATVYQSQNNRAVLAAKQGKYDEAAIALRAAVRAKPDYALGWFNLGVVLGKSRNPVDLVRSQGALAQAVRLDPTFRGATEALRSDHSMVSTGLDISRPVAVGWTFASAARSPVEGLSWLLVALAIWRLVRALGIDRIGEFVAARVLSHEWHSRKRWHGWWRALNRYTGPAVGVVGCGVIAAWPFIGSSTAGTWAVLVTVAMSLALVWLFVAVSRPGANFAIRRGWAPGLVFGAVTAVVGAAFVPVPVDNRERTSWRSRWAGVILLAIVAASGLSIGLLTGVPLVRVLGVGALAMLSSALLPLKPFDGGFLHHRLGELAIAAGLLFPSAALALGWL